MQERRSQKIVNKNFQRRILKIIVMSIIASTLVSLALFYIALRVKTQQAAFSGYTAERLAELFAWLNVALPLISLLLIVLAVFIGRHISFKVAGPLYALEKQLGMVARGEIDKVQVRSSDDELIPLADLINEVLEKKQEEKRG